MKRASSQPTLSAAQRAKLDGLDLVTNPNPNPYPEPNPDPDPDPDPNPNPNPNRNPNRNPNPNPHPNQVLRYLPGEHYTAHHDFFDPGEYGGERREQGYAHNRFATIFFYLNEVRPG